MNIAAIFKTSAFLASLRLAMGVLVICLWLDQGSSIQAAPRYMDKDTALELASIMDKGTFRGALITATFVQSFDKDHYTIKASLDNGGEVNWDLNQLRRWVQENYLTLNNNRVLVFPNNEDSLFEILDKNAFSKTALNAKVYAKYHEESDVLSGQTLYYGIKRFNLVDLLSEKPKYDDYGYKYRYVLDLENGQREYLSYRDALGIMKRNAFTESAPGDLEVLRTPYKLLRLKPMYLKNLNGTGLGQFGVEMQFDRPVALMPGHFPFRLYETRRRGKPTTGNQFIIEFTAPNTVISHPTRPIGNVEFLHDIRGVSDPRFKRRVLVQAHVSPEVLAAPPEVLINGDIVQLTFTKVKDQSVYDRKTLHDVELRRRQHKLKGGMSQQEIQQHTGYLKHMEEGLLLMERARDAADKSARRPLLEEALVQFREAGIAALNDAELEEALRQRNRAVGQLNNSR